MKRLIPILSLLLCQGCITCLKGDLAESNLDAGPLPVVIGRIEVEGLRYGSEEWLEKQVRQKVALVPDAACSESPVDLSLTYTISGNYWQTELMPKMTLWTLGLLPLYANGNADIDIAFVRSGTLLYRTRLDSRSHSFYGWLPPFAAAFIPAGDWLDWEVGADIDYFVETEAVRRTVPRLSRLLKQEKVLRQICPQPTRSASRGH